MSHTDFKVVTINSGDSKEVKFDTEVKDVGVAVQGFDVSYGSDDHNVLEINVSAAIASITGNKVTVTATCLMSDTSNHKAKGSVDILVIADCEDAN